MDNIQVTGSVLADRLSRYEVSATWENDSQKCVEQVSGPGEPGRRDVA